MATRIRSFLYARLLAAVLACGLLTGAGCVAAGLVLTKSYLARVAEAGRAEALRRIENFDLIMGEVLEESRARGGAALLDFARRYPDLAAAAAAGPARLRAEAAALGVREVYFVDRGARVAATSFLPDLGLDFSAAAPAFAAYLAEVFAAGRIMDQGLSRSTVTRILNHYQYYAPPGRDYLVEVSARTDDLVEAAYPGMDYVSLATAFLGVGTPVDARSPVLLLDYVDAYGASLFEEKVVRAELSARIAAVAPPAGGAAGEGSPPDWRAGGRRLSLVRVSLGSFGGAGIYAYLSSDESILGRFLLVSCLVALAVLSASGWTSFALARDALGPRIASRLEGLSAAMERVGRGEAPGLLDDGRQDEIGSIGRRAAAMVDTILAETAELKELARRLEEEVVERRRTEEELRRSLAANEVLFREVDHRVKNNLQLVASLARLEADARASPEATRALARMEARALAMAMVEDQVLAAAGAEVGGLDLGPALEDALARALELRAELRAERPVEGRARVEARVAAPEDAVALVLAAFELADNAARHGYGASAPTGSATPSAGASPDPGLVSVTLSGGPDGSLVLEVADEGRGMASGASPGLGLGLVQALAAQRGGRLEVEPGAEGRGLAARVVLPGLAAP